MAPILIDETGIKRLGFITVLALILTFIAGYFIGSNQAGLITGAGTGEPQLSVSDTTVSTVSDEQKKSVTVSKSEPVKYSDKKVSVKAVTEDKVATASVADSKVKKSDLQSAKVDKQASTEQKTDQQKTDQQDTDDNLIKYSIQTAVYGQLSRAEKSMNKLLEKNIEAYVTDYINNNNKVWYNVRFGYFKDKKSALSALDDYKKSHGGDGYLVNFSAERIVDFDEQKYYEDTMELKPEQETVSGLQPSASTEQTSSQSADSKKHDELPITNTNAQLR